MSKRDKLLGRFLSRPKDITFEETTTLMGHFGYYIASGGKTGGSRVSFTDGKGDYIRIHKPHPNSILKLYQVDDILTALSERGLL
ncbi:MAG: type II toxin-antitoxin system HicA family toxin [Oscillospiraceae bacterium]|nr:type II toxin-antitoxin system HicA family toxin [Oscillospiraceae bacterium]